MLWSKHKGVVVYGLHSSYRGKWRKPIQVREHQLRLVQEMQVTKPVFLLGRGRDRQDSYQENKRLVNCPMGNGSVASTSAPPDIRVL